LSAVVWPAFCEARLSSTGPRDKRQRGAVALSFLTMNLGKKLRSGGEFHVFELEESEVLKVARNPWLMYIAFGDFRRKTEEDLRFLQKYFSDIVPPTRIIEFRNTWAIRQRRIDGTPFFDHPRMTAQARSVLERAARVFQETGQIPDLLNPRNLLSERHSGRLYLVDTSVLDRRKWWPVGFLVTRLLARVLYDTVKRWLLHGFDRNGMKDVSHGRA